MPMITVFEKDTISQGYRYPRYAEVPGGLFTAARTRQMREVRLIGLYDREDLPDELPEPTKLPLPGPSHGEVREQELRIRGLEESLEEARAYLQKMYREIGLVKDGVKDTVEAEVGDSNDESNDDPNDERKPTERDAHGRFVKNGDGSDDEAGTPNTNGAGAGIPTELG